VTSIGRGPSLALVLTLVGLGMPTVARAQTPSRADDPARRAFQQGMAALQGNRPADAVRWFTDSYQRRAVPIVQYDLALAYRALGRNLDAATAFERYLADPGAGVDAARLAAVRAEAEALRGRLVQITLALRPAGATVLVDGRVTAVPSSVLLLDPGSHALEVRADGYVSQRREEDFAAGAQVRWEVALVPVPAAPPSAVAGIGDGRDAQRMGLDTGPARRGTTPPDGASRRAGWVVPVGVTLGVLAAAGIALGVWAALRDPGVELPATTTGLTVETIRVPSW
jgi:hypothetical protein